LESDYINLSGIGTTNIVIPDNKKHKNLIQRIKVIMQQNKSNVEYVGISILSVYKSFKIRGKITLIYYLRYKNRST
jgi:hypothetical protein